MSERGTMRALVDVERHALQPGFAGEVGGRLAGLDALRDRARRPARCSLGVERALGHVVQRVERQAERPQHQPRRFVEGVGRAVPKRNARLFEAGACARR